MLKKWSGMFASVTSTEAATETLFVKSQSFNRAHQGPAPLQLTVSKKDKSTKSICSGTGAQLLLQKASIDCTDNQFQWLLSDNQTLITIRHGGVYGLATVMTTDGAELTKLQRGGFSSVVKFRLGKKTYRWSLENTINTDRQLKMRMLEEGCKDVLAEFEGPGSQCKLFWIDNPAMFQDHIQVSTRTDSPLWVQLVIATGMVAAKMQRRHDKFLSAARRPNDWQC